MVPVVQPLVHLSKRVCSTIVPDRFWPKRGVYVRILKHFYFQELHPDQPHEFSENGSSTSGHSFIKDGVSSRLRLPGHSSRRRPKVS